MKSRWRDGLKKFRRDNNVHWRGYDGRYTDRTGTGFDSCYICGKVEKEYWGRYVHKAERRAIKEELRSPETLADAYWELYTLGWEDSWFESETEEELNKLGLNKFDGRINIDLPFEDDDFSMYDAMEDPFDDLDHFDPRHDDIAEAEEAGSAFDGDIRPVGYYDYLDEAIARRDAADIAETNFPSLDVVNL